MSTKNNPGKYDCLGKAEPDEPVFILLARDAQAVPTLLAWAIARLDAVRRGARPPGQCESDLEQVREALQRIGMMARWRAKHRAPAEMWRDGEIPADLRLLLLDRLINRLDDIALSL